MKKYFSAAKKQFSTLALGSTLIVSTALALINCTDPVAPTKYTVTFDTNGGKPAVKDKTVEDGKLLAKPATELSKEGFSFIGWYKDKALTQAFNFSTEKITQNITLYAKWIEVHTVTFDTNGGEPSVKDKIVEAGKLLAKPTTEPTKEGHTFDGWYKDRALTQAFSFTTEKITSNITLYAKWIETYTVTFNVNGGTPAVAEKTVETGTLLTQPQPEPTKTGYTFAGWYKDQALTQTFDFDTETITADITLYAKWIETYTVTFNLNGGTPSEEDKTVAHGERVQQPSPNPTKTDSLFAGWYRDQALTQTFDFDTETITADITLYAKWKSPLVDIPDDEFRARLKRILPAATFTGDQLSAKSPEITEREELYLAIFSEESIKSLEGVQYFTKLKTLIVKGNSRLTSLNLSSNTQLTMLECRANSLTVLDVSKNTQLTTLICDANNLTALDVSKNTQLTRLECQNNRLTTLDVSKNTQLTRLECQQNYSLNSLDVSKNTQLTALNCGSSSLTSLDVSKNTQLTTLFCSQSSLTHLDMRGMRSVSALSVHESSNETNVIDTLKVHENLKDHEQIKAVKTARGSKVTISTYSAAEGSTAYTAVCNDYDPTVDDGKGLCFDNIKYTVTFNSNGGSSANPIYLSREQTLSKPADPTKTGYRFTGWYKDQALTQAFDFDTQTVAQDITLYAKWIAIYTVTFNLNGGTPNEDDKTVETGTLLTQPSPDPTKTGYTFAGWYKDAGLTQRFGFSTEKITQNITLYAKWIEVHTVTFNLNGGTPNEDDKTVETGTLLTQPSPDPTKTDSVFAGWYKDEGLTQAFDFYNDKITADITLYARWVPEGTAVTYTVAFNLNGGTATLTKKTVETGTLLTKPSPDPTKTDSVFAGWYKDEGLTQAFGFDTDTITAGITLHARWASNRLTTANKHLLSRVDADKKATIREGVVSIGEDAFSGNGLTAVALPNSLTTIGEYAFQSNNLTSVTIPDSVTTIGRRAFEDNSLTSVTLSDSLTAIGEYAFRNNNLTSVVIPDSVTTIGEYAFLNNNLATVTLSKKLYDSFSSGELANRFGNQVTITYQTSDGTKLNN